MPCAFKKQVTNRYRCVFPSVSRAKNRCKITKNCRIAQLYINNIQFSIFFLTFASVFYSEKMLSK